jgi:putative transposase
MSDGSFTYLATWLGLFSRHIVGWQVENHMEETLIIRALEKALFKRSPAAGLILHSDRGGQYVSDRLRKLIKPYRQSMSRKIDSYDNAFAESLFSRFKAELLQGGSFLSLEDARTEIFEYIEMYYDPVRRHSALGYKSPMQFEKNFHLNLSKP